MEMAQKNNGVQEKSQMTTLFLHLVKPTFSKTRSSINAAVSLFTTYASIITVVSLSSRYCTLNIFLGSVSCDSVDPRNKPNDHLLYFQPTVG